MMHKRENNLDHKISAYMDSLFAGVGESREVYDLKEELAVNLKEKTMDYQSRGLDVEQAFKEAVISMGDLGGLVDEMRDSGLSSAGKPVYTTTRAAWISIAGIVAGVLLALFGVFTAAIIYFQDYAARDATGPGIFIVAGGALLTYGLLTRETAGKYGMNKIRAACYALSVGLVLFSLFVSLVTYFADGEMYVAIASPMLFFLTGVGLFLLLILTETNRAKTVP